MATLYNLPFPSSLSLDISSVRVRFPSAKVFGSKFAPEFSDQSLCQRTDHSQSVQHSASQPVLQPESRLVPRPASRSTTLPAVNRVPKKKKRKRKRKTLYCDDGFLAKSLAHAVLWLSENSKNSCKKVPVV